MLIKVNNLTIRNATSNDAEVLAKWWNDGKIMAHAGFPNGTGRTAEDIKEKIKNDSDDSHRRLIIDVDDLPIGEMNYRNKGNFIAEIGIKICEFSKQDTNVTNKRAQHIYEKIGFRKIRVNEDSWTNQLGELQSSIDYELVEEEFNNFSM